MIIDMIIQATNAIGNKMMNHLNSHTTKLNIIGAISNIITISAIVISTFMIMCIFNLIKIMRHR